MKALISIGDRSNPVVVKPTNGSLSWRVDGSGALILHFDDEVRVFAPGEWWCFRLVNIDNSEIGQ